MAGKSPRVARLSRVEMAGVCREAGVIRCRHITGPSVAQADQQPSVDRNSSSAGIADPSLMVAGSVMMT
jgi:hypothetical protein